MFGRNLTIGKRLSAVFALIILVMALVGIVGFQGVTSLAGRTEKALVQDARIADDLGDVRAVALDLRRYEKNIFIRIGSTDERAKKDYPRWQRCVERLQKRLAALEQAVTTEKDRQMLAQIRTGVASYVAGFQAVQARIGSGELTGAAEADAALGKARDAMNEVNKTTEEAVARWQKTMQEERGAVAAIAHRIQLLIVLFSIGAVLFSSLACALLSASLTRPIGTMQSVLEALAAGDLTRRVEVRGRDELSRMGESFNGIVDRLQEIIGKLARESYQLSTAANEFHMTSKSLATGTESVASQTHSVATASEEMAATSAEIAQSCSAVVDSAGVASSHAASGVAVVEETVQEMSRIAQRVNATAATVATLGESSDAIGDIIVTIEDIADQTNLLALNAAIEAARAGEQGRGFAVVADEVRALAERTTLATKQIGTMIKKIQQETRGAVTSMKQGVAEVEKGTAEAAKSGAALKEILAQIDQVTGQIRQISVAAEEQTATTSEISTNIQQITDVMGHTVRDVRESSSAAAQVAQMAEELREVVSFFRTGRDAG
ncbi:methyl-accepting chemotaxis protein [Geomesophilobacter sediminis]|uniref:Methyl-accepting chemotaxis protein n=1 Tax=Geomesophilobacter sediminis TaxID=2798584 RepID=A0A8J7J8A8_9BACT|nr:methyl-accepting chemotaxis protein [Geomesophilobacter sediminis]MBJ6725801.1 methyl-accepting chemotaxis protein [Geomesophilobacter sediminis]